MEIKLNIGKVIEKPCLKDTFVLHVKSMSGDADEFHTNIRYFDMERGPSEAAVLLEYFIEYSKLDWNTQCDLCRDLLGHETLKGFENIEDALSDLVGRDVTSDWCHRASPDSVWITYLDFVGAEHHVDIEVAGVAYTKIHRTGLEKKCK